MLTTQGKRTQKSLLDDIAFSTASDPSLAVLVSVHPHVASVITNQAIYVSLLVSHLKSACFAAGVSKKKTAAVLAPSRSSATPLQVQITVVGCGNIGSKIVEALLESDAIHPTSLSIVTRQPELLTHFVSRGVRCFKTVDDVIDAVDLFIITTQPGQFSAVAKSMKGRIPKRTLCLSTCCGVPVEKVCAELAHANSICTSVDVDSLGRCVATWTKEDDSISRYQRAAYAASKTFAEAKDVMSAEERSVIDIPSSERHKIRGEQILEQSFPASMSSFYNRLTFTLVSTCMCRGIDAQVSTRLVWESLLPKELGDDLEPPVEGSGLKLGDPVLVDYCSFATCAELIQIDPRMLFVAAKDRFHEVLRKQ